MFKWFTALSETASAVEGVVEQVASTPAPEVAVNSMAALPLFTKGLLVTLMGLMGVFLVLTLFFVTIKLMQKIGK